MIEITSTRAGTLTAVTAMNVYPHTGDSYFDETVGQHGRFVLPKGAEWTQVVYRCVGINPQTASIVRLAGETDAEAGVAWAQEYTARHGEAVEILVCSDDDGTIEAVQLGQLVLDAQMAENA